MKGCIHINHDVEGYRILFHLGQHHRWFLVINSTMRYLANRQMLFESQVEPPFKDVSARLSTFCKAKAVLYINIHSSSSRTMEPMEPMVPMETHEK